jgi:hypothetical protein
MNSFYDKMKAPEILTDPHPNGVAPQVLIGA